MAYSVALELEDGGSVTYDNVISCTIEEAISEPSPDEVPEDGDEERGEETDPEEVDADMAETAVAAENPMDKPEPDPGEAASSAVATQPA